MRVKNRVEKVLPATGSWDQNIAVSLGRKGLDAGGSLLSAAWDIRNALRGLEDNAHHPAITALQKKISTRGWGFLFSPAPPGAATEQIFRAWVTSALGVLLDAIALSIKTGSAESIRGFADALETTSGKISDPLASYLLSTIEGSSKTGFKQTRFLSAQEIHSHMDKSCDIRTIRRRAKELKVALRPVKRGAPAGKPHKRVNRVVKSKR